jgi:L-lactate dehydrogenase complex protein LldG
MVAEAAMSSRDTILDALKDVEGPPLSEPLHVPTEGDTEARFAREIAALGAEIVSADRLAELKGASVFADDDVPAEYYAGLTPTASVWEAEIGMTLADLGVAETGSLVLSAGPKRHRLASLAPPHHIALLPRANLVQTLDEAMMRLGPRTGVFITGPSRTADIEGVLVRGIHGPGKLWVLLTD